MAKTAVLNTTKRNKYIYAEKKYLKKVDNQLQRTKVS